MRQAVLLSLFATLAVGFVTWSADRTANSEQLRESLKAAAEFAAIGEDKERSVASFQEAGKVIQHPRCVNCHPASDRPLQNDEGRPHIPLVVRGEDGLGAIGMRCTACHGSRNFEAGHVPGHPKWHVAPIEMAWEGRTLGQICEQVKDPKRNGGMTLEQIVHHMGEDDLVGWAWNPGPGRTPAPGTQKEFGALIKLWAESGAHCPPS